jgi:Ca2+-binding EF-hand superfamily protein
MKKMICALSAIAILVTSTGLVTAADDKPKKKKDLAAVFKKLDKDNDGKLTKAEFIGKREGEKKAKAEKAFARKDKDSDGNLTVEEFSAAPKKKNKKDK